MECIKSVSEFVNQISALSKSMIRNGVNKNEVLLFRGQSSTNYELVPSIARNRKNNSSITIFNEERNLIDTCKYKMPDVFSNNLSPIELLALLQHHDIPTRLLDVTENALVALFFACNSDKNKSKEGEVFAFKHNDLNTTNFPFVEALADSYRLMRGTDCEIDLFYQRAREQLYFIEQRSSLDAIMQMPEKDLLSAFGVHNIGEYIESMCKTPLFVYAPIRSLRQRIQLGRYILFNNDIEDDDYKGKVFVSSIKPIPKDHECIVGRYTIPAENKSNILQELKLFGISKEVLFCDNTDIVCEEIKNSFKNKVKENL